MYIQHSGSALIQAPFATFYILVQILQTDLHTVP